MITTFCDRGPLKIIFCSLWCHFVIVGLRILNPLLLKEAINNQSIIKDFIEEKKYKGRSIKLLITTFCDRAIEVIWKSLLGLPITLKLKN